jgi:oligopeptide/dipeptide ABC transporter ATP-binding protein
MEQPSSFAISEELLRVEELRTAFFTRRGVVPAVDGIDLTIHRGEILGLVGESGSGKSVTAMSILRLVSPPGRVIGGRVIFRGTDLLQLSDAEMRRVRGAHIGMVFQDPMTSLNPVLRVGEQVLELYKYHPDRAPAVVSAQTVVDALARVRIPDPAQRARDFPLSFSGGMRQRVGVAMATACGPELVIADEPTTALDVTIQTQILQLLLDLRSELGVGVLFITHDLGIVAEICDTVAVMYAGKVVECSDVRSIFKRPRHPYTRALIRSLPRLGERTHRLATIEGQPPSLEDLPSGCSFWPRCPDAVSLCKERFPEVTPIGENDTGYVRCWVQAGVDL